MTTYANSSTRTTARITALVGILVVVFFGIAYGVLASAINWPAALKEPASKVLPLIKEQRLGTNLGYFSYLISSLLFIPLAYLVRRVLDGKDSVLMNIAVVMGVLTAVFKSVGIVRWLFVMPVLADKYTDPTTAAASRDTISLIFDTLNAYLDNVGQFLGDGFFSGLWTLLVSIIIIRGRQFPAWLGYIGVVVGIILTLAIFDPLGFSFGAVNIGASLQAVWVLIFAALLFRSKPNNEVNS